ncbi:hypothetical protein D5S17_23100 [Pseudonocardiaceae bacterium YIM PH 21723]|nr:hypothetical protein D5S17_23100 [Pseudonocardiaceae bacterium YIM PH 21723]
MAYAPITLNVDIDVLHSLPPPGGMHHRKFRQYNENGASYRGTGWSGMTPAVPRQLPVASATFTARDAELRTLDELRGAGRKLIVIQGIGGVGKTQLALRWLDIHGATFTDGNLFADLGAFLPGGPTAPAEILGRFLRALGVPAAEVPAEFAELVAQYRSLTAGRSVSVLLDNASTAAQVSALLPSSPASVVLVTSRWRLPGLTTEGAATLDLSPLPTDEAVVLLANLVGDDRVGAEPLPARELADICGGLPIAVSVVGARLANRPKRSLATLAAELRQESARIAGLDAPGGPSLRAVMDRSYDRLPDQAARLYRLVAWHPGEEFGLPVLTAAIDRSGADVSRSVETLVRSSLLEEFDDSRFRFHDLLRLHGQGQAEEQERDRALHRMADWYLRAAIAVELTVLPRRWRVGPGYVDARAELDGVVTEDTGREQALNWLESERSNYAAMIEYCDHRGWDELTWQLSEALWSLFVFRGHYGTWLGTHELGVIAARRCAKPLAEVKLRCQLAYGLISLRRFAEAVTENQEALAVAERVDDLPGQSEALQYLGICQRGLGDPRAALGYFRRSLDIDRARGHVRGQAFRHRRIAEVLTELGGYEEAVAETELARGLFRQVEDRTSEGRTLMFLGTAQRAAGRLKPAMAALTEAGELLTGSGATRYRADALAAMGDLLRDTGDLVGAREHWTRAHALYAEAQHPQAADMMDRLRG